MNQPTFAQPAPGCAPPLPIQQMPVQGMPVAGFQPYVVVAGGGGPVLQVSEERLVQMAKSQRFVFEDGKWKMQAPSYVWVWFLFISIIIFFLVVPFIGPAILVSPVFLGALIVPIVIIAVMILFMGKGELVFDDSTMSVYYKNARRGCLVRERIISYSDCISFNSTFKVRGSNSSGGGGSYYEYSLQTVQGNFTLYSLPDNLEEASLNAFLRERLAVTGNQVQMPPQFTNAPVGVV